MIVHFRQVGLTLLPALSLIACLAVAGPANAANPSACGLLEPSEVEAVVGPLAGAPFRSTNGFPDATGDECRYETKELRAVTLRVEWSDGALTYGVVSSTQDAVANAGLKGVLKLSDGTKLTGAWDQARVFMCCEVHTLTGKRHLVVDISGSRATIAQAAKLADAANKRLAKPLTPDDAAALAAATTRNNARPKARSVCELLTRADAEAIAGTALSSAPKGDNNSCTYSWKQADGTENDLKLAVTWRGGFGEYRLAQSAIGKSLEDFASQGVDLKMKQKATGLFDEESSSIIGEMAVKKDVMLTVETGAYSTDTSKAFMAKAAEKLR
jgi:hypothetical protein